MSDDTLIAQSDFPPTSWTLVRKASKRDDPDSFMALSLLCERYWYPLYAFVRCQGASPDDAADEVQGFFNALLQNELFDKADQEKGRLRSYLIKALKHYRSNEHRSRQTLKRGGGQPHLSIDQEWAEGRLQSELIDDLTPEEILNRTWARLVLDDVAKKLRSEFTKIKNEREFDILFPFLAWNTGDRKYSEAAAEIGISEDYFKVKVYRLRNMYRVTLKEQVRETLNTEDDDRVQDELRYLLNAL